MQRFAVFFSVQPLAGVAIGKQLRDLGKDFEVLLSGLFGDEQEDQQRDRLAVRRFEGDGFRESDECGERLLEAFDPPMRDRDAFAEPGRAEWFSKIRPACSNTRFLLVTDSPMTTFSRGRNLAKRFILAGENVAWILPTGAVEWRSIRSMLAKTGDESRAQKRETSVGRTSSKLA
jgi:hypothetical protein